MLNRNDLQCGSHRETDEHMTSLVKTSITTQEEHSNIHIHTSVVLIDYFKSKWLRVTANFIPCTNNALESFNRLMRKELDLRKLRFVLFAMTPLVS